MILCVEFFSHKMKIKSKFYSKLLEEILVQLDQLMKQADAARFSFRFYFFVIARGTTTYNLSD